jgi:hypothetical protein
LSGLRASILGESEVTQQTTHRCSQCEHHRSLYLTADVARAPGKPRLGSSRTPRDRRRIFLVTLAREALNRQVR